MSTATRYLVFGQICLFGFLVVCLVLTPHYLFESNEGGVSNYGVAARTVVPYTLAFGLGGAFSLLSAWRMPTTTATERLLRRVLLVFGWLLIAVLLSTYPYKLNHSFDVVHQLAGSILVIFELVIGSWSAIAYHRNIRSEALFGLQLLGFALFVLNYFNILNLLFVAEMVSSIAFGVLLIRTLSYATSKLP